MNTPNNKRKLASIEKLEKVFINLLQRKDLNQINVSDICKRANINRTTFYAHYEGIYELADSIRAKLEENMIDLYKEEISLGFNSNNYLVLSRHIKENQLFYKTYFKLGYDEKIKLIHYDHELARKHFNNRFINYHMEFFKSGLTRIIKMWLENGCEETPEEMFEIIQSEYQGRV